MLSKQGQGQAIGGDCAHDFTDMAIIAKIAEKKHPGKLIYKFVSECSSADACQEVRKYMADMGFKVKQEESFKGDHYGLKEFDTYEHAKNYMDELFDKFNADKPGKVNTMTLDLQLKKG